MATSNLSANPVTCGQIRDFVLRKLPPNRGDAIRVDKGNTSLDDNIAEYEVLVGRNILITLSDWERFILQVNITAQSSQARLRLNIETDPRVDNCSHQNLFFERDDSVHDLGAHDLSLDEPLPLFDSLQIRDTGHYYCTHSDRVRYIAALNVLNQLVTKDLEKPEATAVLTADLV